MDDIFERAVKSRYDGHYQLDGKLKAPQSEGLSWGQNYLISIVRGFTLSCLGSRTFSCPFS